jgi:ABC transporter DrrB family efflux protein
MTWAITDTWVLTRRNLLQFMRSPGELVFAVVQPIMFVLLFRYVFGGAIATGRTRYVDYLMAGVFVQSMGIMSMATGTGLAQDLASRFLDRLRSLPMAASAVFCGRTVATLVRGLLVAVALVAVGLLVGLRPRGTPAGWLGALGVLLLFGFAVSWIGVAIATLTRSAEAVQNASMTVVMPLTFLSSAFVPTATMPPLLRSFAHNQPITKVIDAVRGFLLGRPNATATLLAVGWCAAIVLVFAPLAIARYRRL